MELRSLTPVFGIPVEGSKMAIGTALTSMAKALYFGTRHLDDRYHHSVHPASDWTTAGSKPDNPRLLWGWSSSSVCRPMAASCAGVGRRRSCVRPALLRLRELDDLACEARPTRRRSWAGESLNDPSGCRGMANRPAGGARECACRQRCHRTWGGATTRGGPQRTLGTCIGRPRMPNKGMS